MEENTNIKKTRVMSHLLGGSAPQEVIIFLLKENEDIYLCGSKQPVVREAYWVGAYPADSTFVDSTLSRKARWYATEAAAEAAAKKLVEKLGY